LTLGYGDTTETLQYGTIADNPAGGGTVGLTKIGAGTLSLAINAVYSGYTTVSAGTLALVGSGVIPNSAVIAVASNATFDVSQVAFTLGTGQVLTGGGMVNGSMQADGTIAPAGTLTFNGNLTFDGNLTFNVNTSHAQSNDVVRVINGAPNNTGTGTLTVNNLGPALIAGQKFYLFDQPLPNGGSLTIVPPAGVVFTNNLALDGSLTVVSSQPPPPPQITSVSLSGTNLVISGTNGMAGEPYNLLTTTNLTLPLSQWTVLPTNTFSSGNFSITNPVDPGTPRNFYILRTP
jgi:fibronectin-binding autotransporter adhesin